MSEKGLPTVTEALDKAANTIKGGDLETGKEILKWVLEREPNNVLAWLWMSRCVKTNEAKLDCFNRVLAIDPSNKHALEGVQRYSGEDGLQKTPTRQQPSSTPPAAQASAKQQENVDSKEKPKRRRLLMIIGGGLILLCMCSFAAVLLIPDSDEATPAASVSDDLQNELPVADSAEDLETAVAETMAAEGVDSTAVPEDSTPLPTLPQPTSSPIPPTPTPILGLVEVGTHLVGEDIDPGIYKGMAGEGLLASCYWERLSGLSGTLDDIIANDNANGLYYIEVKDTDVALGTECGLTQLEHAQLPANSNPAQIGPGTYLIGRDIQPGRYRGQAGTDFLDSCYWGRLSDVSGELNGLLANDNATGQYFVEVAGTDFALTTGCALEFIQP